MSDQEAAKDVLAHVQITVDSALQAVQDRLVRLRAERGAINDEIRGLVAQEEVLTRVAKVSRKQPPTERNDDG